MLWSITFFAYKTISFCIYDNYKLGIIRIIFLHRQFPDERNILYMYFKQMTNNEQINKKQTYGCMLLQLYIQDTLHVCNMKYNYINMQDIYVYKRLFYFVC